VSSHGGVDAIGQERKPPKKPVQLYSYSEGENEAPRPINDEPVEIERDVPETADTLFEHFNGLFGMAMKANGIGVKASASKRQSPAPGQSGLNGRPLLASSPTASRLNSSVY
jgi:hypothetical protein